MPRWGVKKFREKRLKKLPETMSMSDVARALNMSIGSVAYWIAHGLPSSKSARERWIDRDELIAYLDSTSRIARRKEY
jgi:hypothetical protein